MKNKRKKRIVGTSEKPRLVVYRSLKYIYGQIIDDTGKKVLTSISNKSKSAPSELKKAKSKLRSLESGLKITFMDNHLL